MSKGRKKASATNETSAELTSQDNSNTEVLINQDENDNLAFADYVELDPTEPDNPREVRGRYWCFVL